MLDPDTLATGFNNLHIKSDLQNGTDAPDGDFLDDLEDVLVRVVADSLMVRFRAGGTLQALAYPIRSLSFEYFDQAGTALTTKADIMANATGVRFTMSAPITPVSSTLMTRQTWVYLENRR